jgi:hypothetical protein
MTPLTMPEKRGQTGKVTVESVSRIVFLAREMQDKGQRLRLKSFTQKLNREIRPWQEDRGGNPYRK